jgi:hypothetical protein
MSDNNEPEHFPDVQIAKPNVRRRQMSDNNEPEPVEITATIIKRSELCKGDLIVVSCPGILTDKAHERLVKFFGDVAGVKVAVLEMGIKIDAILGAQGE